MLRLAASQQARAMLQDQRASSEADGQLIYSALRDRIRLICSDPGDARAKGLVRRMDGGALARVSVVLVPEVNQSWVIVWTLGLVGGEDAVQLHMVAPYEG